MNEASGYLKDAVCRMVGEEVALPTASPEPCMKVSLHPAPQCTVSFHRDTFLL